MKDAHKKKLKKPEEENEEPTRDSRGFSALAELTSSEVVKQVKMGMAAILPDDEPEEDFEETT